MQNYELSPGPGGSSYDDEFDREPLATRRAITFMPLGAERDDAFTLDLKTLELSRRGREIPLTRLLTTVLSYFVERPGALVERKELLSEVWRGTIVSNAAIDRAIADLRSLVGDDGKRQRVIRTVRGRGYRLVANVSQVVASSGSRRSMPFTERERVMRTLQDALESALVRRGRLVVIAGEAGIGKSRVCAEMLAQADTCGIRVVSGRCREIEGSPAFWPWIQLLRRGLREGVLDELPAAGRRLLGDPDVEPERAKDVATANMSPAEARRRLFDELAAPWIAAARREPLVLVLDDLHAADLQSLRLLAHLAGQISNEALAIVGTYGDVGADSQRDALLAEIAASPIATHEVLSPLSFTAVEAILARVVPEGTRVSSNVAALIHERSHGNPFFVHELIDAWVARGASRNLKTIRSSLPIGIRDAVAERFDWLSIDTQGVLLAAVVVGREFDLAVLARVLEEPAEKVLVALTEAEQLGIIERLDMTGLHYRFVHALFVDTLYEGLSQDHRVAQHARAAHAMRELHRCAADGIDDMARHYGASAAIDPRGAVAVSRRAAEKAAHALAYDEATGHLARALEILPPGAEDTERSDILLELVEHAAALLETGSSWDDRTARTQLERARALGTQLRLTGLVQRIDEIGA